MESIEREKERDLTQSYDKSPYTNRNVKRATTQRHHQNVRLHSDCGRTKDGQIE